ncbi:MAG: serine/threonine protein kinase [Gammaproteobacteria bacterium]|nr:serine/threonine protein kinase [Gammaproteobacteria bacterium]
MAEHLLALPPGYELQEYRLERLLGAGGFGITYLGVDTHLNKPVAIKEYLPNELAVRADGTTVLPKSDADKGSFDWGLERFIDEARTLARFKHPNIVQVYRYFQANGTGYIVMEYCEGETLARLIKRNGPMSESAIKQLLMPVLDGLVQVHGINFLHRDIKPGNIIVRPDGEPVLLDFGAARQAVGAKSRSVTAIVTPGFAPIEQYSSKGNLGPWTDIYALGAVAYACISGRPPPEAADRILDDTLAPLSTRSLDGYSTEFLLAIDSALSVRERDRPADVSQWRAALLGQPTRVEQPAAEAASEPTMLATRALTQTPPSVSLRNEITDRVARPRERKSGRLALILGVLVVLGGAAAGGWWWFTNNGMPQLPALSSLTTAPEVPAGDVRQQAIALEAEVESLMQGIAASLPALQRQAADAQAQRAALSARVDQSTNDVERRTLSTDLNRMSVRTQRLQDEISLIERWVSRENELARIQQQFEDARAATGRLDYAGAAATLTAARDSLTDIEQMRKQLSEALDERSNLNQKRFAANAILEAESLPALDDDRVVASVEADADKALDRGDFSGARQFYIDAQLSVRDTARERMDAVVEDLKREAAVALDARDAPPARLAIDRAKRLVELRKRL